MRQKQRARRMELLLATMTKISVPSVFSSSHAAAPISRQLSLGITHIDDATFDNFYRSGDINGLPVQALQQQFSPLGEAFIFLWGGSGCGLTHLLQAACRRAQEWEANAQYITLEDRLRYSPEYLLDGLEVFDLIAIDGIHLVVGDRLWELALFHLFNRLRDAGKKLLIAANIGPHQLAVDLPDLHSRLQSGVSFQIQQLNDQTKQQALQQRAHGRGLELTDDVARYILQRAPRDMSELFRSLEKLDHASLAEQRKLTIPFVKQVLGL